MLGMLTLIIAASADRLREIVAIFCRIGGILSLNIVIR